MPTPTADGRKRPKAKNRLKDMLTQEVSLVDAAANLKRFRIAKNMGQLTIKAADRERICDALNSALSTLSKVVDRVGKAEDSDEATVSKDVLEHIELAATALVEVLDHYQKSTEPPAPAADDEKPAETKPADETPPAPAADVEKAGRKLSAARRKAIQAARDTLSALLDETNDVKKEQGEAEEEENTSTTTDDLQKLIADGFAALQKQLTEAGATKKSVADLSNTIARMRKNLAAPAPSNVGAAGGTADPPPVKWPYDLARGLKG